MAPKRKSVWKRDESAKEARRARSKTENQKNAEANAKRRIEDTVQSKFEKERACISPPITMSEDVKSSPLVKAMEGGFLDDLKVFHMKDYKFMVPILQDPSHVYVSYIIHALRAYFNNTTSDAVEQARVETILNYFEGNFLFFIFFS
jgi:hypothetical protein